MQVGLSSNVTAQAPASGGWNEVTGGQACLSSCAGTAHPACPTSAKALLWGAAGGVVQSPGQMVPLLVGSSQGPTWFGCIVTLGGPAGHQRDSGHGTPGSSAVLAAKHWAGRSWISAAGVLEGG